MKNNSTKIRMENNRPSWQKDVNCYYCYSCFNYCSMQAILVKNKYIKKDGRYHHHDIARQKY